MSLGRVNASCADHCDATVVSLWCNACDLAGRLVADATERLGDRRPPLLLWPRRPQDYIPSDVAYSFRVCLGCAALFYCVSLLLAWFWLHLPLYDYYYQSTLWMAIDEALVSRVHLPRLLPRGWGCRAVLRAVLAECHSLSTEIEYVTMELELELDLRPRCCAVALATLSVVACCALGPITALLRRCCPCLVGRLARTPATPGTPQDRAVAGAASLPPQFLRAMSLGRGPGWMDCPITCLPMAEPVLCRACLCLHP